MSVEYVPLTPEEEQFFATGQLPASAAPVVEAKTEPVLEAKTEEVVTPAVEEPAVKVVDPNTYLEQMLQQTKLREAELERQMQALQAELKKVTQPAAPDPATDPLGSLMHQMKEIRERVDALNNKTSETVQQSEQQKQQELFMNAVTGSINAFKTTHPDYDKAYEHLRTSRIDDLVNTGYSKTEANQLVNNEEYMIALRALQTGKDPAAIAYNMAVKLGYKTTQIKTDPESKVEQIKKGLEAAKTISPGKPTNTEINLSNVAAASDEDLNALVESDAGWAKLIGAPNNKSIF